MIITNVNISQKSQEILLKAAAEKRMSVEELASVYSMVGWVEVTKPFGYAANAQQPRDLCWVSLSLNLIFVIS